MTIELQPGDQAPAFDLPTDGGGRVRLADLKGKTVVLYLYPKDDTAGCTSEAQQFTTLAEDFKKASTVIIGLSKDSADKAARLGQFPGGFSVGRLYRVNWSAFVERSGLAGGEQPAEKVGGVLVAPFDHVGVDPQRGRGVRMS